MTCPCCGSDEIKLLGQLGRKTWGRCVICGTDVDLTDREEVDDVPADFFADKCLYSPCSKPAAPGDIYCSDHAAERDHGKVTNA